MNFFAFCAPKEISRIQKDVKVVQNNMTKFYAVDDDTLENMENTAAALQYVPDSGDGQYQKLQFSLKRIDSILVQLP